MKILVTGGAGYIGSHTVVELLNNNYEVIIADNLSNSNEGILNRIEQITSKKPIFEKVDLSDALVTENLFFKYPDIALVLNFAAYKAVGESVAQPLKYYRNNLSIILNLLESMQKRNILYFVQSSSCTVYGIPDQLPIKEDSPIKDTPSPYGKTKQMAEEILIDQCHASNLQAILLRYFNPIGAHDSHLLGELPNGVPNNLMPFITQTAIGIREKLSVFGNDYNTPDGTCIRDYIHVVDLAIAHVKAIEYLLKKKNEKALEVFNIGTGNGFSVLEVIKSFEKTSQEKLNYIFAPRREGDVPQIWADAYLAKEKLGWQAQKTLDEMTLSAWLWEKELKNNKI